MRLETLTEDEENRDSYLSWVAAIDEMRRRNEAGEPIGKLWREAEKRQRNRLAPTTASL